MRIGSLFSGYGGLDLAVEDVLDATPAWFAEIDAAPSKILAHHWPDVPNLGDITAVDWAAVEPVDILTGGFPCQDLSHAGKRAGLKPGTRSGLWQHMAYAIDQLRPALVVAENVRGLLSAEAASDVEPCPWCVGGAADGEPALRALGCVLGALADLGYDAAWHGLRAADVGAPHGRFRVFVVAWPAADTDCPRPEERRCPRSDGWHVVGSHGIGGAAADARRHPRPQDDQDVTAATGGRRGAAADAECLGEPGRGELRDLGGAAASGADEGLQRKRDRDAADDRRAATPDASGIGRDQGWTEPTGQLGGPDVAVGGDIDWGSYAPAIARWSAVLGRPAPAPTELGKNGQRLSPAFVEWMMGLPLGHVTDVPGLSRNDQLKALGNGVVPLQAAAALRVLLPLIGARWAA